MNDKAAVLARYPQAYSYRTRGAVESWTVYSHRGGPAVRALGHGRTNLAAWKDAAQSLTRGRHYE